MKAIFFFILISIPFQILSQNLEDTSSINITKNWSQEPNGYTYPINIKVPPGPVPSNGFPVCILLHGNGGNGGGMINQFMNILECHALVAPTGYLNSWNICDENSEAPDVEMVSDLVNILQGYSNINPNQIRILGSSNGAGLANNVFIENTNIGIDIVCAIVSHLNVPQYHSNDFHYPSSSTNSSDPNCGYDVLTNPLTTRKYLSISNSNDPIIPYSGGTSVVGVDFLSAEEAAYNIALNQGYIGNQLTSGTTIGTPEVTEFSYLSGDVVHIKGDAAHGTNATQRDYIKDYFSDCITVVNVNNHQREQIKIYPNPTNSIITIEGVSDNIYQYSIMTILGKEVLRGSIFSKTTQIDLSELTPNVYFLKINEQYFKIVKSR